MFVVKRAKCLLLFIAWSADFLFSQSVTSLFCCCCSVFAMFIRSFVRPLDLFYVWNFSSHARLHYKWRSIYFHLLRLRLLFEVQRFWTLHFFTELAYSSIYLAGLAIAFGDSVIRILFLSTSSKWINNLHIDSAIFFI